MDSVLSMGLAKSSVAEHVQSSPDTLEIHHDENIGDSNLFVWHQDAWSCNAAEPIQKRWQIQKQISFWRNSCQQTLNSRSQQRQSFQTGPEKLHQRQDLEY